MAALAAIMNVVGRDHRDAPRARGHPRTCEHSATRTGILARGTFSIGPISM
jgi:hypothetical protein